MDISKLLLTPQPAYEQEGGLSDIGSAKYNKRELQRRWEALDTIYVEEPVHQVTFHEVVRDKPVEFTRDDLWKLINQLLED